MLALKKRKRLEANLQLLLVVIETLHSFRAMSRLFLSPTWRPDRRQNDDVVAVTLLTTFVNDSGFFSREWHFLHEIISVVVTVGITLSSLYSFQRTIPSQVFGFIWNVRMISGSKGTSFGCEFFQSYLVWFSLGLKEKVNKLCRITIMIMKVYTDTDN